MRQTFPLKESFRPVFEWYFMVRSYKLPSFGLFPAALLPMFPKSLIYREISASSAQSASQGLMGWLEPEWFNCETFWGTRLAGSVRSPAPNRSTALPFSCGASTIWRSLSLGSPSQVRPAA